MTGLTPHKRLAGRLAGSRKEGNTNFCVWAAEEELWVGHQLVVAVMVGGSLHEADQAQGCFSSQTAFVLWTDD